MLRPNNPNNNGGANNNQRPPQHNNVPPQRERQEEMSRNIPPNITPPVQHKPPPDFGGDSRQQNNKGRDKENDKRTESKSSFEIYWDNFTHFVKEAFLKTPYETIFELALLVAGGTRTIQLFNTMGQSGFAAVVGLIYSEVGIILYEFLMYKGKRVKVKKTDKRTGMEYEVYPFINQKSLAKIGLWLVHIPLTVFFTTSDLILENLNTISGDGDMTSSFAWILGLVIGAAFLADLIILINYKEKNPARAHDERMFELLNEKEEFEFRKEEIKLRAQIEYEKKNAKPLIELEAKFGKREEILQKYSPKFGEEYVNQALENVGLDFGKPNRNPPPSSPRSIPITPDGKKPPQPEVIQKQKQEEESDEELIKKLQSSIGEHEGGHSKTPEEGAQNFQNPRQQ